MSESNAVTVITLIKLAPEVDPDRFAEFARSLDLPTWRAKDVVLAFDTYRASGEERSDLDADFVEVMRMRSLTEWEEVGKTDPDIAPLGAAFDELAQGATIRRIRLTSVE